MRIERAELAAFILLGIGVVLLILTFYMAFTLVGAEIDVISSSLNLSEAIGEILGPIVEAIIKVMYLGVMGWTGSIATIRGVQLLKEARRVPQSGGKLVQESTVKKEEITEAEEKPEEA